MKRFIAYGNALAFLTLYLWSSLVAASGWHYVLSQSERNARIVAQAQRDIGSYGGSCKKWATNSMLKASGGEMTLPRTAQNGEAYYWDSSDQYYAYVSGTVGYNVGYIKPGQVIQMRTRLRSGGYTPHTAIVIDNFLGPGVLVFAESNYDRANYVTRRQVGYSQFLGQLETRTSYTVYTIR